MADGFGDPDAVGLGVGVADREGLAAERDGFGLGFGVTPTPGRASE